MPSLLHFLLSVSSPSKPYPDRPPSRSVAGSFPLLRWAAPGLRRRLLYPLVDTRLLGWPQSAESGASSSFLAAVSTDGSLAVRPHLDLPSPSLYSRWAPQCLGGLRFHRHFLVNPHAVVRRSSP
jgi:hypothetical protein